MAICGQASNRTPAFAAHCVAVGVSDYLPVHFLSSRSSVAHGLESVQGVSDYLPVKKVKILICFSRFGSENERFALEVLQKIRMQGRRPADHVQLNDIVVSMVSLPRSCYVS